MGTIAQLCPAMSSQLRHVLTIGKNLLKQQYLLGWAAITLDIGAHSSFLVVCGLHGLFQAKVFR